MGRGFSDFAESKAGGRATWGVGAAGGAPPPRVLSPAGQGAVHYESKRGAEWRCRGPRAVACGANEALEEPRVK